MLASLSEVESHLRNLIKLAPYEDNASGQTRYGVEVSPQDVAVDIDPELVFDNDDMLDFFTAAFRKSGFLVLAKPVKITLHYEVTADKLLDAAPVKVGE